MRALLVLLLAVPALADSVESWNTVEANVATHGRFRVAFQGQFRVRLPDGDFFQLRAGPILRYSASERLVVMAGYYFREQQRPIRDWGDSHRTFGGVLIPLTSGRVRVVNRALLEHHFGGWAPDQVVFRDAVRLDWMRRGVGPFGGSEVFIDQHGFFQQRIGGGVRLSVAESSALEFQYHVDVRRFEAGGNRHVLTTAFRFDSPLHLF